MGREGDAEDSLKLAEKPAVYVGLVLYRLRERRKMGPVRYEECVWDGV